ncbi:MAG: hypothetical protein LBR69_06855 [Endomicrobium sp.]|nr:hypothetical protein [Endomicrobium sp.]
MKKIKNFFRKILMRFDFDRKGFRVESREQSNVMSALLPCIYIICPLSVICFLAALYLRLEMIAIAAFLFFILPPTIYLFMFIYFGKKSPMLLMSEKHQVQIMQLENIKQEGKSELVMSIPVIDDTNISIQNQSIPAIEDSEEKQ